MPQRTVEIQFPLGGLDRALAYQNQRPFTSPDLLNVRPRDALEDRLRGGSRPGTARSYFDNLGNTYVTGAISSISYDSATGLSLFSAATPSFTELGVVGRYLKIVGGGTFKIASFNSTSTVYLQGDASGYSGYDSFTIISGEPVVALARVHPIPGDTDDTPPSASGFPQSLTDTFDVMLTNGALESRWSALTITGFSGTPTTNPLAPTYPEYRGYAGNLNSRNTAAVLSQFTNFSSSSPYTVSITCDMQEDPEFISSVDPNSLARVYQRWQRAKDKRFFVFAKLDNTTPALTTNGIAVAVNFPQNLYSTDVVSADLPTLTLDHYVGGVLTTWTLPIQTPLLRTFKITVQIVNTSVVVSVGSGEASTGSSSILAITSTIPTSGYDRVGFGAGNDTTASWDAYRFDGCFTLVNDFKIDYTQGTEAIEASTVKIGTKFREPMLVGISGGRLWREKTPGVLEPWGQREGVCQAGSTGTTIVLAATETSDLTEWVVDILVGAGFGASRRISAYNTGTQTATIANGFSNSAGDKYRLRPVGNEETGRVVSATTTTVVLELTPLTKTDLTSWTVDTIGGTGRGQSRTILSYNTTSRTATISVGATDWTTTPDATTEYRLRVGNRSINFVRDGRALMTTELHGKLIIGDYAEPRAEFKSSSVNGTALTNAAVTGFPAPDFRSYGIDMSSDVAVLTNPQGSAVAANYSISAVNSTSITLGSSASAGASTCNIMVGRAPKIYDPIADTITILAATAGKGQVPICCPILTRYRDRLVLGGFPPHVWYMSRQGDYQDWDYGQTDEQRAVAGVTGEQGVIASPLTTIFSGREDYLVFGCRREINVMRGDPTVGIITNASDVIGIIDRFAYCMTPDGYIPFLSEGGLNAFTPSSTPSIEPMSARRIPRELVNIDTSRFHVSMLYDQSERGIHLYVTPKQSGIVGQHWWIDWQDKTFWPVAFPVAHNPISLCQHVQGDGRTAVFMGCEDGFIRNHDRLVPDDDGETMATHAVIGPLKMGVGADYRGTLMRTMGVMGAASGQVTLDVLAGDSPEAALAGTTKFSHNVRAGKNVAHRPRVGGVAAFIKLTGQGAPWAMESIVADYKTEGREKGGR